MNINIVSFFFNKMDYCIMIILYSFFIITYEYANLFSTCDENIKKAEINKNSYTSDCERYEEEINGNIKEQFKEKCPQTFSYLNEIQTIKHNNSNLYEAHCVYLYYFLYYSYKEKGKNGTEIKNPFNELIRVNNEHQDAQCTNFRGITISDDEILKLKDIHDMYTELNKINNITDECNNICHCAKKCAQTYEKYVETCNYNNIPYFCTELLNIKKQYDAKMINKVCEPGIPRTLRSFKSYNIITLILIPICITLAISSFLFFLYKVNNYVTYVSLYSNSFTPYGSSFRCSAINKRKQYNNIDKEINIQELSENSLCSFRKNGYHILYKST
ncbi:variable surface protein [Plasmodium gonderi]|uniref:Variable surface protein n=1 Tax=Plasmodium gonderi TaxID=77519 RepID=A0A1Y1JUH5_PLAGO|nr:variable surface protein [Plasmodium gonderi]GAW84063.1 variable surface protein [Plasmodium gonderi]